MKLSAAGVGLNGLGEICLLEFEWGREGGRDGGQEGTGPSGLCRGVQTWARGGCHMDSHRMVVDRVCT